MGIFMITISQISSHTVAGVYPRVGAGIWLRDSWASLARDLAGRPSEALASYLRRRRVDAWDHPATRASTVAFWSSCPSPSYWTISKLARESASETLRLLAIRTGSSPTTS